MDTDQVASLVEQLAHGTPKEKCAAALAIGQLGAEAAPAVPALVKALADPSHNDEESCDQGFTTGYSYPVDIVAEAAAGALGMLGSVASEALPALRALLSSNTARSELRESAAGAIARMVVLSPGLRAELLALLVDVEDKGPVAGLLLDLFPGDSAVTACVAKYLGDTIGYPRKQLRLALRLVNQQARPQEVVPVLVGLLGAGGCETSDILHAIRRFGPKARLSTDELLRVLSQVYPWGRHKNELLDMLRDITALSSLQELRSMLSPSSQDMVETLDAMMSILEGDRLP